MTDNNTTDKTTESGISRRDVLFAMGAAATAAYAGNTLAAMPGHDHSKHAPQHEDLLGLTNTCLDKGQRCIAHCLVSFREGDTELAICAAKVHEMQAVCSTYAYLLASNSSYAKAYSAICSEVCKDCETECMKHKMHIECKECGEACNAVVAQIKRDFG